MAQMDSHQQLAASCEESLNVYHDKPVHIRGMFAKPNDHYSIVFMCCTCSDVLPCRCFFASANSPCTVVIDEMLDCNLDKAADAVIRPNTYDATSKSEKSLADYPSIAFIDVEPDVDPADRTWEQCGIKLHRDNLRHFIARLWLLRAPWLVINVPVDLAADCAQVVAGTGNYDRVCWVLLLYWFVYS